MKLFGWLKWLRKFFSCESSLLDKVERRCLADLLKRLPLDKLYRVDQEKIAQAKPVIMSQQRKLCLRKDAITIYLATNVPADFKFRQLQSEREDSIYLRELTRSTCHRLVKLFPRITQLRIVYTSWSVHDQVLFNKFIYLLNKWSKTLHLLSMDIKIMPNPTFPLIGDHYVRLWHQIESMQALKYMRLFTNTSLHSQHFMPGQINLSFLSQLIILNLYACGDLANELADTLMANVDVNSSLKSIYLSTKIDKVEQLDKFLEMESHLANRFVRMVLFCQDISVARLNAFCVRFNSLRSLYIDPRPFPTTEVVRKLRSMKQLDTLHILFDLEKSPLTENCIDDEHYSLKSVKTLDLCLILKTHDQLASSHIEKLFPNLEKATVTPIRCVECQYDIYKSENQTSRSRGITCKAALMSNSMWNKFAHLRQVLPDTCLIEVNHS